MNKGKSRVRKTAAVMVFVLLFVIPVYAATPDTPTATTTPSTAATRWTNQSASVDFAIPDYSVTVTQPAAGGTIKTNKNRAKATDTVTVTATPANNYAVDYFVINGTKTGTAGTNILSFEMPAKDTTVTAVFKKKNIEVNTLDALAGNAWTYYFSTGVNSEGNTGGWMGIGFKDGRTRAIRPPTPEYYQPTLYTDSKGRDYVSVSSHYSITVTGGANNRNSSESKAAFATRDTYDLGQFSKLRVTTRYGNEKVKVCLGGPSGKELTISRMVESDYSNKQETIEYDISAISGSYK